MDSVPYRQSRIYSPATTGLGLAEYFKEKDKTDDSVPVSGQKKTNPFETGFFFHFIFNG